MPAVDHQGVGEPTTSAFRGVDHGTVESQTEAMRAPPHERGAHAEGDAREAGAAVVFDQATIDRELNSLTRNRRPDDAVARADTEREMRLRAATIDVSRDGQASDEQRG